MGANRTRFLANRRLQPLGHLSAVFYQQFSMCLVGSCRPVAGHALQQIHRRLCRRSIASTTEGSKVLM